ncbi:unnamed protein product [Durusdinium trenchii]|uniref:C3H1-type domain-containing protein n=1 Tax=Durusdinium trenchii TaxID=1381693 RepID=A0ABP0SP24_9DINO
MGGSLASEVSSEAVNPGFAEEVRDKWRAAGAVYDEAHQRRIYLNPVIEPVFDSDDELAEAVDEHSSWRAETRSQPKENLAAHPWQNVQVPVRNTFIHFDCPDKLALFDRLAGRSPGSEGQSSLGRSASSPLLSREGTPLASADVPDDELSASSASSRMISEKEAKHLRGECRPCAYFNYKKDGCRLGETCAFCHLCSREARKKKVKPRRSRRRAGKNNGHAEECEDEEE